LILTFSYRTHDLSGIFFIGMWKIALKKIEALQYSSPLHIETLTNFQNDFFR